jgi:hypothetical protein
LRQKRYPTQLAANSCGLRQEETQAAELSLNARQITSKLDSIFVVGMQVVPISSSTSSNFDVVEIMKADSSFEHYVEIRQIQADEDRMPLGFALLAILGLSIFGWAILLAPVIAISSK